MKRMACLLCILLMAGLLSGCNQPEGSALDPFAQTHRQTQNQTEAQTQEPQNTPEPSSALNTVQNQSMTLALEHGTRNGVYNGDVRNGVPHGQGSFTAINDSGMEWTYTGEWVNGHMNGFGETVWEDGWSEEGIYADDCLTEGSSYDEGVIRYSGEYAFDNYHGWGTTYDLAGNTIYEGKFYQGYLDESEEDLITRADSIAPIAGVPTEADYQLCLDYPNSYFGEWVMISGQVVHLFDTYQNDPAFAEFVVLIDGDDYYPVDIFYRYGWDEPQIREGDWVTCYGIFAGTYTYTGQDGYDYTMPVVQPHAVFIEEYYQ